MSRKRPEKKWPLAGKIGVATFSTIVTFLAFVLVLKIYATGLGIRDPDFRYENQIEMWRPDPIFGFRNKANFDAYCFGTVHVTTNEDGFRGQQPVSREKSPGKLRIIGLGDSVMWGTSVDQTHSFLGLLQTKLASQSQDFEVINAGVVGYSTIQEALYFEERLISYDPDVVLINFCENDLMPSEDPFHQIEDVYSQYLLGVVNDSSIGLSARDKELAEEFIKNFRPMGNEQIATSSTLEERIRIVTKLCLEAPVRGMIGRARERGIRLIFLMIPPRDPSSQYTVLSQGLMSLLEQQEVEYLDMGRCLHQRDAMVTNLAEQPAPGFWSQLQQTVLPDLRGIRVVHRFERMHRSENYIDFIHPSKKGNEIIAQQIVQYLKSDVARKPL